MTVATKLREILELAQATRALARGYLREHFAAPEAAPERIYGAKRNQTGTHLNATFRQYQMVETEAGSGQYRLHDSFWCKNMRTATQYGAVYFDEMQSETLLSPEVYARDDAVVVLQRYDAEIAKMCGRQPAAQHS